MTKGEIMEQSSIKAIEDFLIVESDTLEKHVSQEKKALACFVFGGKSTFLSQKAAEIYMNGYCRWILVSGGYNDTFKNQTEAEFHCGILKELGVPSKAILLETQATNTKENVIFGTKLLDHTARQTGADIVFSQIIVVCMAFHARRVLMTFKKWCPYPELIFQLVYPDGHEPKLWCHDPRATRHIMDELRKISEYASKGDIRWE
jgi:uncharacterized SAM-binding protein YcdF (DUF218 family)